MSCYFFSFISVLFKNEKHIIAISQMSLHGLQLLSQRHHCPLVGSNCLFELRLSLEHLS